jgi:hypothetical protein
VQPRRHIWQCLASLQLVIVLCCRRLGVKAEDNFTVVEKVLSHMDIEFSDVNVPKLERG